MISVAVGINMEPNGHSSVGFFFSQKPNGYSAVKDTMKKNLPPILLLAITYQIFAISNFDSYSWNILHS